MDDLVKVILASRLLPQKKEWVGLTDEEVHNIISDKPLNIVRAIEAKLREKNAND